MTINYKTALHKQIKTNQLVPIEMPSGVLWTCRLLFFLNPTTISFCSYSDKLTRNCRAYRNDQINMFNNCENMQHLKAKNCFQAQLDFSFPLAWQQLMEAFNIKCTLIQCSPLNKTPFKIYQFLNIRSNFTIIAFIYQIY